MGYHHRKKHPEFHSSIQLSGPVAVARWARSWAAGRRHGWDAFGAIHRPRADPRARVAGGAGGAMVDVGVATVLGST